MFESVDQGDEWSYTPRMKTLHFSTRIDAPADIVWETMLDDATYRQWTRAFGQGSHFVGTWLPGSEIRFLGDGGDGTEIENSESENSESDDDQMGGLVGVIREHRPHEFVSIEYRGMIVDGIEDTTSEAARRFIGAHENYAFAEASGVTTVSVHVDVDEAFAAMFAEQWPRALQRLAELAEAEVATRGQHPDDQDGET